MAAGELEVKALGMRFEGLQALTDVSLTVPAGQIHGLIGPNGAGKTTLFNCLTGFYQPTGGEVWLSGARIDGLPPYVISEAGVSRTFQNIRLFANMTAIENVLVAGQGRPLAGPKVPSRPSKRFGAKTMRAVAAAPRGIAGGVTELAGAVARMPGRLNVEKREIERSRRLLASLGLTGRENVVARSLPYGDQRRLEIARALAPAPRLLLLDEPTAGMNPQESASMIALIRRLRDEFDTTVVLIEHQMRVVMGVCEHITVLDYGREIASGTPAEVQRDTRVIEAYLGTRGLKESGNAAP